MRWIVREITRFFYAAYCAGCAFDAGLDGRVWGAAEDMTDTRAKWGAA